MKNWIVFVFIVLGSIGLASARPKDHKAAAVAQMAPTGIVKTDTRTVGAGVPVSPITSHDGGTGDPTMLQQDNEGKGQYLVITSKTSNVCVCTENYFDAGVDPGNTNYDSRCGASTCTCDDSRTDGQPVIGGTQRAFAFNGTRVPCVVGQSDAGVVFTAERIIR